MTIFYSTLILGILGFVSGTFLAYSSKVFEVKEDPRIEEIVKVLPGINCGACGYPGCAGYAKAIIEKGEDTNKCLPGRKMGVEQKIKEILDKYNSN